MARYIDVDILLKKLESAGILCDFGKYIIKKQPAVDIVPIVRCYDCKKWNKYGVCDEFTCEKLSTGGRIASKTNGNDYGSYGVRKDVKNNG